MLLHGPAYHGRLPCLLCRHARRRKGPAEWRALCGACRGLTEAELSELLWYQEEDDDRVVVPPSLLRHSRRNADARYAAALDALRREGVAPGARVLDIGCGISTQATMFRKYLYVGADLNRRRLQRAHATQPGARYAVQDIRQMGWRSGSFDAILCLEVIEHVAPGERETLVRELLRVLRRNGVLVLSTPNGRLTPWKWLLGRTCERSHKRELPPEEVAALLATAGAGLVASGSVANFLLPGTRLGAVLVHLLDGRPRGQAQVGRLAARAGYETRLYVARPRAPA